MTLNTHAQNEFRKVAAKYEFPMSLNRSRQKKKESSYEIKRSGLDLPRRCRGLALSMSLKLQVFL